MAQGALGSAGVRRVWAGAGLQRAAHRGGGILRGFPHSLLAMYSTQWHTYGRVYSFVCIAFLGVNI